MRSKINLKVAMLLTIFIVMIFSSQITAYAEKNELIAEVPTDVSVGRSFDVNFSSNYSKLQDISAIEIKLYFDKNNLSVKGASTDNGEIKFYDNNGCVTVIALFDNGIADNSPIFTVTFTAKTGQDQSLQTITPEFVQAVDKNLKDVNFSVTEKLTVNITRASSLSSEKNTTQKSNNGTSSRRNTSKTNGASDNSSKNRSSGNTDLPYDEFENDNNSGYLEDELEKNYGSLPSVGSLNSKSSNIKYMIVGGVLSFCIISIIFIAYRVGKISVESKIIEEKEKEKEAEKRNEILAKINYFTTTKNSRYQSKYNSDNNTANHSRENEDEDNNKDENTYK